MPSKPPAKSSKPKEPRVLSWRWLISMTITLGILSGGLTGWITAWLTWRVEVTREERERITAKIEAVPKVVMHIDFNRALAETPIAIIGNEGPVAASALNVSVEQFFVQTSNGVIRVNGSTSSRMSRRPWLFITNSLAAGGAVEIPLGRAEIPNSVSVYRLEAKFYPEFNLTTHLTTVTNFIEIDGVARTPKEARHFLTNVTEILRLVDEQSSTLRHSQ